MNRLLEYVYLAVLATKLGVEAAVFSRDLHIVNAQLAPDSVERSTVVAEGTFPGPLIAVNKGDNLQINVIDELTDDTMLRATSIHWHGLFQHGTNEMDGPAFVTQCPIIPNNSFLYNFSVPDQAGTYWYHSHYAVQYCDGLRGPLIIYDPDDPQADLYDVDDASTVITLADWYHGESTQIFPGTNFAAPTPDSVLINGQGRFNGSTNNLTVVTAQPGKRHRFRIISTSCFSSFLFSIDGHNMTIIEADGQATEPLTVDSLNIFAAQRYSVIVTADQAPGNYWIRAVPTPGTTGFAGGINSAILNYAGVSVADPTSTQTTGTVLDESNLHALIDPAAPGEPFPGGVDMGLQLTVGRNTDGRFEVNNVPFISPSVPVLLQILNGNMDVATLLPQGSIYSLPANQTIEINFPGGGNHPFHLHGHTFSVVRSAGSNITNYVNPVKRDTVSIGNPGDNVTFRFVTDNAGPWFLHCHIDWHLDAGLAVVFAEDLPDVASVNPVNTAWQSLCPDYNNSNPDTGLPMRL